MDSIKVLNDCQFTHNTFRLRGPTSPLEVKFNGLALLNATRMSIVSANSVNCVAVEADVTARHNRLLVAGEISLSGDATRNRLSLGNTTLMPNLLDFPAFMCMLWAPFVELRVNRLLSERTFGLPEEICGALCGVGFDPATCVSYDANTDIELLFDSSVTSEDIDLISLLRYQISQLFYMKGQHIAMQTPAALRPQENMNMEKCLKERQQACRQTLLTLLNRTRFDRHWFATIPQRTDISPTYRWNLLADNSWRLAYRNFQCRPFSEALLANLNLKTAVLMPINIPILNLHRQSSPTNSWENEVLLNLDNLEKTVNLQ